MTMKKNITANQNEKGWKPCKINNKLNLTMLDAIEQVVILAEGSALCPQLYRSAKRPLRYISERLSLTTEQALLLSLFVNFSDNSQLELCDISRFLSCTQIMMLRMSKDIDELIKRRIVGRCSGNYYIKKAALQAVRDDKTFEMQKIEGISLVEFFSIVQQYLEEKDRDEGYEFDLFWSDLDELLHSNTHLPFVQQLLKYHFSTSETIVFLKGCCMLIYNEDNIISRYDYNTLLSSRSEVSAIISQMNNGSSKLISEDLFEPKSENGMVRPEYFCLTEKCCNEMLTEMGMATNKKLKVHNLINAKDIAAKQLFYNTEEEAQISQLESLLQPLRFNEVCDRLSDKGMRRGFACIFDGAPGTGKTETALQLARKTGRDIIPVNVSELRDKYVGTSEKRVKALFDNYRKAVTSSDIAPILLFNEADAIISKRSNSVANAVDKMENALQNIILQEMENLEGILIATTNLTQNMDSAFERRFLYKVEFEQPSLKAKQAIWQSMIPSLGDEEAMILASEYEFSGGQIENIARKQTVEQVLSGIEPNLDSLRKICNAEYLHKHSRPIGFKTTA